MKALLTLHNTARFSLLALPLLFGACSSDNPPAEDPGADPGSDPGSDPGGDPQTGSSVLCDGTFRYERAADTVNVNSSTTGHLATAAVDFDNGVVAIQANFNEGDTARSLALTFAGITTPGPGTYTPVAVLYTVIDIPSGMPTESFLSLSPGDFETTFSALDVTGVTASFSGGNLLGGAIGAAPGNLAITNGSGDHQACNEI